MCLGWELAAEMCPRPTKNDSGASVCTYFLTVGGLGVGATS